MTIDPRPGEVWWVNLEPTLGSEANKTRPVAVIGSPDFGLIPLRFVVPSTAWQSRFSRHRNKVRIVASTENGLDFDSGFDALHTRSVSLDRFMHRSGTLEQEQLDDIMRAIAVVTELAFPPDLSDP